MKKALLSVSLAVMLLLPLAVFAQLSPPTPPISGTAFTLAEAQTIINRIAQFLIAISLIIAVIFIIWGGIRYMAAGADAAKAAAARQIIFNGIIGALVVLAIGVILQTLSGVIARTFFS
jgi:hypothetical protein